MADQRPKVFNRRSFFREGLRELLGKIQDAASPLAKAAQQFSALEESAKNAPPPAPATPAPQIRPADGSYARIAEDPLADLPPQTTPDSPAEPSGDAYPSTALSTAWLRPPGALEEDAFRTVCSRCGICSQVCPAHCIKIDPTATFGNGLPYIDVDTAPCIVCSGLECMNHCPSGALVSTSALDIDMGTAVWKPELCIRQHGQDCTTCVDQCPLGCDAIELRNGKIEVVEEGCIGCGLCQHYCPTSPKSIVVIPKLARGGENTV